MNEAPNVLWLSAFVCDISPNWQDFHLCAASRKVLSRVMVEMLRSSSIDADSIGLQVDGESLILPTSSRWAAIHFRYHATSGRMIQHPLIIPQLSFQSLQNLRRSKVCGHQIPFEHERLAASVRFGAVLLGITSATAGDVIVDWGVSIFRFLL